MKLNLLLKNFMVLVILIIFMPACVKKGSKKEEILPLKTVVVEQKEKENKNPEVKPLFDDNGLEGFTLEEKKNTFSQPSDKDISKDETLKMEEEKNKPEEESWVDQRAEQTQQYKLKTIYFNFDEYAVTPEQQMNLDYNLEQIKKNIKQGKTIVIEGHACKFAGSRVYNMLLSEKRANSVAEYLIEKGIPKENIKTVGRGYEMCLTEGDKEQQGINRRVEFSVLESVQ